MKFVIFGLGYSAEVFARRIASRATQIVATKRDPGRHAHRAFPNGVMLRSGPAGPRLEARTGAEPGLEAPDDACFETPASQAPQHDAVGGSAAGTRRKQDTVPILRAFPGEEAALAADIAEADAILVSIPPGQAGDPVLARFAEAIAAPPRLRWVGYLSTVGVYGDHRGAWVDETTPPRPRSGRSDDRLVAEDAWLRLHKEHGTPVHIFRIAGIYGPGRSAFDKLAAGTAKRIVKPGQVFNRIHVEDIAAVLEASLDRPRPGAIYNLADNEPSPPQDVITEAARLVGAPLPPEVPLEEAGLSPMGLSFWGETKRVSNRLIREELGVDLIAPTYREGLRAILGANGPKRAR